MTSVPHSRRHESMMPPPTTPLSSSPQTRPSPLRSATPPTTSSHGGGSSALAPSPATLPRSSSAAQTMASSNVPISLEGVLAVANGDAMVALETLVRDRNKLLEENDGLWKIVQQLRDKSESLRADTTRLRNERDRAIRHARNASAAPGSSSLSQLTTSASAFGLGFGDSSGDIARLAGERTLQNGRRPSPGLGRHQVSDEAVYSSPRGAAAAGSSSEPPTLPSLSNNTNQQQQTAREAGSSSAQSSSRPSSSGGRPSSNGRPGSSGQGSGSRSTLLSQGPSSQLRADQVDPTSLRHPHTSPLPASATFAPGPEPPSYQPGRQSSVPLSFPSSSIPIGPPLSGELRPAFTTSLSTVGPSFASAAPLNIAPRHQPTQDSSPPSGDTPQMPEPRSRESSTLESAPAEPKQETPRFPSYQFSVSSPRSTNPAAMSSVAAASAWVPPPGPPPPPILSTAPTRSSSISGASLSPNSGDLLTSASFEPVSSSSNPGGLPQVPPASPFFGHQRRSIIPIDGESGSGSATTAPVDLTQNSGSVLPSNKAGDGQQQLPYIDRNSNGNTLGETNDLLGESRQLTPIGNLEDSELQRQQQRALRQRMQTFEQQQEDVSTAGGETMDGNGTISPTEGKWPASPPATNGGWESRRPATTSSPTGQQLQQSFQQAPSGQAYPLTAQTLPPPPYQQPQHQQQQLPPPQGRASMFPSPYQQRTPPAEAAHLPSRTQQQLEGPHSIAPAWSPPEHRAPPEPRGSVAMLSAKQQQLYQQQQQAPPPQSALSPVRQPSSQPSLHPSVLPFTSLSIPSCAVITNDTDREVLRFRISIVVTPRQQGLSSSSSSATPTRWRVDKLFSDFLALDNSLRGRVGRKEAKSKGIVSLPESKAWKDFSMGKVDQRKHLLETYLQSILAAQIPEKDDFCYFLSTNVVPGGEANVEPPTKEGYLTKRGQRLGGWKRRYFVLGGLGRPVLDTFDGKNGAHLSSIPIAGAQIGRSKEAADGGDPNQRHAFLIIEALAGSSGKTTRHILCAESDEERDDWVKMLVKYTTGDFSRTQTPVERTTASSPAPPTLPRSSTSSSFQSVTGNTPPPIYHSTTSARRPSIRKLSKDDIVIGSARPLEQQLAGPEGASLGQKFSSPIDAPASMIPGGGAPRGAGTGDGRSVTGGPPFSVSPAAPRHSHTSKSSFAPTINEISSSGSLPNLSDQAGSNGGRVNPPLSSMRSNVELSHIAESPSSISLSTRSGPPPSTSSGVAAAAASLTRQEQNRERRRASVMPPPRQHGGSSSTTPSQPSVITPMTSSMGSIPASEDQHHRNGALSPENSASGGGGSSSNHKASSTSMDAAGGRRGQISGPKGGAPIPAGFKFGARDDSAPVPDRERKAKSGRWGFGFGKITGSSVVTAQPQIRPVFGVPLHEALAVSQIAELPAVVYRCIEYLEAKEAEKEEGIYRLSGSSAVIKALKDRFNTEGDVDLMREGETVDPHAIAGLLKSFLRELTTSLLTRELHMNFLAVIDLVDSRERVTELRRLVAELPSPNYSLLRALTAHLILIVENAPINKMTLRNVGIVFSPTLGIPAGVFSELVSHFQSVFDDVEEPPATTSAGSSSSLEPPTDEQMDKRSKRNSMTYLSSTGPEQMLGLQGRKLSAVDSEESGSEDLHHHSDDADSVDERGEDDDGYPVDEDPTIRMGPPPSAPIAAAAAPCSSSSAPRFSSDLSNDHARQVASAKGLQVTTAALENLSPRSSPGLPVVSPRPTGGVSGP